MRIDFLLLRNFEAIKYTMHTKEISIDFSKMKSKICLFIGPNGSGKTTVLSSLHPFATIGNLDVRDKLNLIIEGENGYKEIHISDEDTKYKIKHFYIPNGKSHSVKSYIEKNGVELNPNGNVTSFKEMIKLEFGIEMDYLRLIRIGNNVTTLIDLSETERKNFMSKLLDDIDAYLILYKKVNNDLRRLKEMISHNSDKLNRLGVSDKNELKKEISKLENNLIRLQDRYGELSGEISVFRHDLSTIGDIYSLKESKSSLEKKISKMNRLLSKKDSLKSTDPSFYKSKIEEISDKVKNSENKIEVNKMLIKNMLDQLDDVENQLRSSKISYQNKLDSSKELIQMKDELKKILKQMTELTKNISLSICDTNYDVNEFNEFVLTLKNIQNDLQINAYSYGREDVSKVISMIEKNENVQYYIDSHLIAYDDETEVNNLIKELSIKYDFNKNNVSNCNIDTCDAKKLWNQIGNLIINRQIIEDKKSLEYYRGIQSIYSTIINSISELKKYDRLIRDLPKNINMWFKTKNMFSNISSLKPIFNETQINNLLSEVTDINIYKDLDMKAEELRNKIDAFANALDLEYIKNQIHDCEEKSSKLNNKIDSLKSEIFEENELIKSYKDIIEEYTDLEETFEKYDLINNELLSVTDKLYKSNLLMENIQKADTNIMICKKDISYTQDLIQRKKSCLDEYKKISKEMKLYESKYDEMNLTKNSLSAKEGIPIFLMKGYLNDIESVTNDLLYIAYGGEKYIDTPDISASSFSIPWFNRGKRIPDVKYASQGELSFLTVALSFALCAISLNSMKNGSQKKYNIPLLDEPDGALDISNREKFIQIFESYIEIIKSEQNFLITHNDMFSSYPVDVVRFGDDDENIGMTLEFANYIDIIKE